MTRHDEYPLADLPLARRIERAEAATNAAMIEARAALDPDAGAEWIEVAGACAMYDGPTSFLTQTFGLGVFAEPSVEELDRLERFFTARAARPAHEVSPMAGIGVLRMLTDRGYVPVEVSNVVYRPTSLAHDPLDAAPPSIDVRIVAEDEADAWSSVAAEGWATEGPDVGGFMRRIGAVIARSRGGYCFLAEVTGTPIAAGALQIADGVALLAGASTVPAYRGRGGQRALLRARLRFAGQAGCDLATMAAAPGGGSQRNAERCGFRIAYTRTKWRLEVPVR
jgi:GNAT superfamily N-acetyltransferase